MERDPLALPGDPGYRSGPDSDIEVVNSDSEVDEKPEQINSNTLLKVELVPADLTYVKKIQGNSKRGRKKKQQPTDAIKVIDTGETRLNVQLIRPNGGGRISNYSEKSRESFSDDEIVVRGRGRPPKKKVEKAPRVESTKNPIGRPKKKKKQLINEFKPNPNSTHLTRKSRYEKLQDKKDEFLQQESVRKARYKEKYQKHLEKAKEKYQMKKLTEPKPERILFPGFMQRKLQNRISRLAFKIFKIDQSKSKEELIKEMALEWKADRVKFWENYHKRWKEVAERSVKPMTKERAEELQKRYQKYDQLIQERKLMVNRVSTRKKTIKKDNDATTENSPESSLIGYTLDESYDDIFDENDDDAADVIDYAEYFDDNGDFQAEEERVHEAADETYVQNSFEQNHLMQTSEMLEEEDQLMYGVDSEMLDDYQTNDEIPSIHHYDDVTEETPEELQTQIEEEPAEHLNGHS